MSRASDIRSALEQALALCNRLSLEESQRHPSSSTLIPLLHALLEQDEECTHSYSETEECVACGLRPEDEKIVERGLWRGVIYNNRGYVFSEDFKHDVTMAVTGDFSNEQQQLQYVMTIAKRLNSFGE